MRRSNAALLNACFLLLLHCRTVSHAPPLPANWEISFKELQLGKELGRGAFGVVFKAKWRLQECAVKQIAYTNLTGACWLTAVSSRLGG